MSSFTAGFAARHEAAAEALHAAFSAPVEGFAPFDIKARASGQSDPVSFSPQGPRHFSPADPANNPTEGWDPFTAAAAPAETPFVDPIAAAHAAGFVAGHDAAMAEIAAASGRDQALLSGLAAALGAGDRIDREAIARQLRQTVLFLVSRLVGEVGIAPDVLAGRIETATRLLADGAESAMLRVHPDDVALLEGKLPASTFAVGDAGVARGSFVLESASTIVEDGPELWLEQLAQAVDRVAVPHA